MGNLENKRRSFIKKTTAAAVAGTIMPQLNFGNSDANALDMHGVVGHGDFRYKVDSKWGVQDPSRVPINDCHEMVIDSRGRIFMTTTGESNNNIIIYDRSGKVMDSWGKDFPGAHGLTISGEGREQFLFITDPNTHKVFKTTLDGKILMTFDRPREVAGYTKDEEFNPTETAIGPNGDIYIADGYGQNFIIQYTAEGEYIRHFGGKGTAATEFDCCHGITVDYRDADNPSLLITSRAANEFKRFTFEGEHLETIPLPGCSICRPVIHGDNIYFAVIVTKTWESYDGMLAILDKNNKVVSFPGGRAPIYSAGELLKPKYDGHTFRNPHDVLVDDDGNLYVPQWASGKTYPIKLNRV